jgi:DnaJ family protein C protein 28
VGDFDKLVEEKLREAIANGEFDDLPGKGRPQDLRINPYVPADERMAQDMLRAQGFGLPWIEERRDLLREREALLRALHTSWQRHGGALPTAAQRNRERARWESAVAAFRRDAEALNARIRSHNFTVPVTGMRVKPLDADEAVRDTRQQHPSAP